MRAMASGSSCQARPQLISRVASLTTIVTVVALANDAPFRTMLARGIFNWRARGIAEPFYVLCGYGESGGSPSEAGLYRDAEAAYGYLRDTLGVPPERIVLFGHSLGSAVAVELATRVPAAGLVLDGALMSVIARAQEVYPYVPVRWIARSRYASIDRIGGLRLPKLFLHARADEVIPLAHGRRLFDAASPPKTFVTLAGGHGDAFEVDSAVYFRAIDRFLQGLFARPGDPRP